MSNNESPKARSRDEMVRLVREAAAIVEEALPMPSNNPVIADERQQMRAVLAPVVLRELLTQEV